MKLNIFFIMITIVYLPPAFESVQHDVVVTKGDDKRPVQTSLHTDLSLLSRIDKMRLSAQTLSTLKEQMQPMLSSADASLRSQLEDALGSLTDDDLISSCPSRYVQTASEKRSVLESLAKSHKDSLEKAKKAAQDKAESDRLSKEQSEFDERIKDFMRNIYS